MVKEPGLVEPSRFLLEGRTRGRAGSRSGAGAVWVRLLETLRGSSLGVLLSVCVLPDELEGLE